MVAIATVTSKAAIIKVYFVLGNFSRNNVHSFIITKTPLFKCIENFQIKNSDIFHVSAQNIDCGTRRF